MAIGEDYRDLLRSSTSAWAYQSSYTPSPCLSCGTVHGAGQIDPTSYDCHVTIERRKREEKLALIAQEKKHNENIRKLYWERYSKANYA